jgi:hypothetical protein
MKYLKMLLLLALAPSFAHAATLSRTATRLVQLNDNLQAADITIPGELRKRLDEVSAPEAVQPAFFGPDIQPMITGGTSVRRWAPAQFSGAPTASAAASRAQAAGDQ